MLQHMFICALEAHVWDEEEDWVLKITSMIVSAKDFCVKQSLQSCNAFKNLVYVYMCISN